MKTSPSELGRQLERRLAPIYLVSGDELLLVAEVADSVREKASAEGYTERQLYFVERGFDWDLLHEASANLSLFAQRRSIELRLASATPGEQGAAALLRYVQRPPADTLLLVICPRIERKNAGAKWILALEAAGVLVEVRSIGTGALPGWIDRRMRARGLLPTPKAAQLLADRVEGNLLAASQEIEKLRLLHGAGAIDEEAVREAVVDSARYDVYQLADAALAGDTGRALHVLDGLRSEGVEAPLVVWALVRDLRSLAALAWEKTTRKHSQVASETWYSRRKPVESAVTRVRVRECHALLLRAGEVDGIVKGRTPGQPWEAVAGLVAAVAGACAT